MSRKELLSLCTGMILDEVRRDHHVTMITDECGINRGWMNKKKFTLLRFHQLVRLLSATSSWTTRERFAALGARLFGAIWDEYEGKADFRW